MHSPRAVTPRPERSQQYPTSQQMSQEGVQQLHQLLQIPCQEGHDLPPASFQPEPQPPQLYGDTPTPQQLPQYQQQQSLHTESAHEHGHDQDKREEINKAQEQAEQGQEEQQLVLEGQNEECSPQELTEEERKKRTGKYDWSRVHPGTSWDFIHFTRYITHPFTFKLTNNLIGSGIL